jgi:diguanylate cyclase (GGDEF)-like protein
MTVPRRRLLLRAPLQAEADPETAFWQGHVRIGALSTAVCAGVGLVYAGATPDGPHRLAVMSVGVLALLSSPVILTRRVVSRLTGAGREPWLYAWSASLLLAVTLGTVLDGGARSPLTALFAASLVFTAMGFGRSGAIVMGAATVGGYLLTCVAGAPGTWNVVLTACALAVVAATCTLTAGRLRSSLSVQQELTEQLRDQASRDGLTGCLNHRAFLERLEEEISRARRTRQPLGFVMLDLDDFKRANDTHGHVAADELLSALGAALRRCVRVCDVVGRIGGDEFAILAPGSDEQETLALAERVEQELRSVGTGLEVGVSAGISVLGDADDARELRHRADEALYAAKRSRRGTGRSRAHGGARGRLARVLREPPA